MIYKKHLNDLKNQGDIRKFKDPRHVRIWLMVVIDTVNKILGEDSLLSREIKDLIESNLDLLRDPEISKETAERIITDAKFIIDQIDRQSLYFGNQELEEDIWEIIHIRIVNKFLKSPFFLTPFVVLIVAAGVAILGVFQIQSYRLDIKELSNTAVKEAKQEIQDETNNIRSNIKNFGQEKINELKGFVTTEKDNLEKITDNEKANIEKSATQYVDQLTKIKEPELEKEISEITRSIGVLEFNVSSTNNKISKLEDRIVPINNALEAIGIPDRGLIEKASVLINQSTIFIMGVILISLISIILSIISLIFSRKR